MSDQQPLSLRVSGLPAPQGSKSAFVSWPKGSGKCPACGNPRGRPRAVVTDGSASSPQKLKLTAWRAAIRAAVALEGQAPLQGPVRVRAAFYLPPPKALPRWRWLPAVRPDVDKICRATLDALTYAGAYGDDGQVVELLVRKLYALGDQPTGARIMVEPLDQIEAQRGHAWQLSGGRPPNL